MLTVREVMTTDVLTVTPETPLRYVAELLGTCGTNGAPVVTGGRVVGVISAADILAFAAGESEVPAGRAGWGDGAAAGVGEGWRGDGGERRAFFREMWEDDDADVAGRLDAVEEPLRGLLGWHIASEVMSREMYAVSPDTAVPVAARYMYRERVRRALVMDGTRLVGIVSAMDIARAFALRWFTSRLRLSDPPAMAASA
ncbi:MAG TPA: CBS domain-containing protein [Gemmatimonadaceae bacterium]